MSKRNQKISCGSSKVKFSCPAISVVIPLYNVEKYISECLDSLLAQISVVIPLYNVEKYVGECLDSLLAQTFQNFEVIVVDDCSTDSSPAIVESYAEKFGGRLLLTSMKKNSGGAGFPRNKGIEFSRGEYIYFMDSDDAITPTAFEELYKLAKNFDNQPFDLGKQF